MSIDRLPRKLKKQMKKASVLAGVYTIQLVTGQEPRRVPGIVWADQTCATLFLRLVRSGGPGVN